MVQFLQFVLFGIFSVLEMGNTQMFNYHVNPQKKQSIILIDCFFLRKGFFILKKGGGHWLRTMTKGKSTYLILLVKRLKLTFQHIRCLIFQIATVLL